MTDPYEPFDKDELVMSATSYYLGRRTIAVDSLCSQLCMAWPNLPEHVRAYVQRIVESAFIRDDYDRRHNRDRNLLTLGDDCDRESWERVRDLWQ